VRSAEDLQRCLHAILQRHARQLQRCQATLSGRLVALLAPTLVISILPRTSPPLAAVNTRYGSKLALRSTLTSPQGRPLNMIVHLNVPDSVIMARISGARRLHHTCLSSTRPLLEVVLSWEVFLSSTHLHATPCQLHALILSLQHDGSTSPRDASTTPPTPHPRFRGGTTSRASH
jgi:hypothetical protein